MGTSDMDTQEYGDDSSGGDVGRAAEATGIGRNIRMWKIFFSASALGLILGYGVGGKDTPSRLHPFAFLSGTRKEEAKSNDIKEHCLSHSLSR